MGFVFMQPKSRAPVKVKKSEESQAVLDRLNGFLEEEIGEPIRFLETFWNDQILVITYEELRLIATEEEFPEKIMETWRQDYANLIKKIFYDAWVRSANAGIQSNPALRGIDIDARPLIETWIKDRSAELVTRMTDQQVSAIRYILDEAFNNHMGADETARYIRPIIGLNEQQTAANLRFYNHTKEVLAEEHPRMKPETIERKARERAARYASKQHRYRAKTIAQYELASAYHQGNDEAVRECISAGTLPKMEKVVSTSLDGKVCPACRALEGAVVSMDDEFELKSGRRVLRFALPPFHPNCGCAVKYVEVEEEK